MRAVGRGGGGAIAGVGESRERKGDGVWERGRGIVSGPMSLSRIRKAIFGGESAYRGIGKMVDGKGEREERDLQSFRNCRKMRFSPFWLKRRTPEIMAQGGRRGGRAGGGGRRVEGARRVMVVEQQQQEVVGAPSKESGCLVQGSAVALPSPACGTQGRASECLWMGAWPSPSIKFSVLNDIAPRA